MDVALVVGVALLAAMGCTLLVRHWIPAVGLLACAVLWPFVNHPLEGPVLWVLSPSHGLVLSDLLVPLGVLIAGVRLYLLRRGTRGSARESVAGEVILLDAPGPQFPGDTADVVDQRRWPGDVHVPAVDVRNGGAELIDAQPRSRHILK